MSNLPRTLLLIGGTFVGVFAGQALIRGIMGAGQSGRDWSV